GVILPATLTFNTGAPEIMETVAGACRYRLKGEAEWKSVSAGQSFNVPGNSSFDIEVSGEPDHYVCHFG
ncbi:partial purine/pyrimidine-nucleoside phosphorylase, partial [Rhodocyclaceae bacterium]